MLITLTDSKITAVIDSTGAQPISPEGPLPAVNTSGKAQILEKCSPPVSVVGSCRNDRTILEDRIYAIENTASAERDDVSQETSSTGCLFSLQI